MLASISRETIVERRQPMIRWGAVFAGAFVASSIWVLLQLLAVGSGLVSLASNRPGTLSSIGLGTTEWSLIVPLVALFVGGLVAGRFATSYSRGIGALHGLIMWAFSTMVGAVLTISVLAMLAAHARPIEVVATTANAIDTVDSVRTLLFTGLALGASMFVALISGALGVRRFVEVVPQRTVVTNIPQTATAVLPAEPVVVPPLEGP